MRHLYLNSYLFVAACSPVVFSRFMLFAVQERDRVCLSARLSGYACKIYVYTMRGIKTR